MSSGPLDTSRLSGRGVEEQCSVDDVGELSFERPTRLGGCVAHRLSSFHVGAGALVAASLGDSDAVDRSIELAVASPAQAVAFAIARPDRQGRRLHADGLELIP
jgi:hypothetical protein